MLGSYILSSTFVPVLSIWLLKHSPGMEDGSHKPGLFDRFRRGYEWMLARFVRLRLAVVALYLIGSVAVVGVVGAQLGRGIFPVVDAGQFRLRLRAPDGTHIAKTEQIAKDVLALIEKEVGRENVQLTLGYVGMIHSNFPVNAVYQWSRGPEEAILYVDLDDHSGVRVEELNERLRERMAREMPEVRVSFEPSDIVNEVMSFGSPTPIEVAISGPSFADNRAYTEKVRHELAQISFLRDLQIGQSLDYPTIQVNVDREKAGIAGLMPADVSRTGDGHLFQSFRGPQLLGRSQERHCLSSTGRSPAIRRADSGRNSDDRFGRRLGTDPAEAHRERARTRP